MYEALLFKCENPFRYDLATQPTSHAHIPVSVSSCDSRYITSRESITIHYSEVFSSEYGSAEFLTIPRKKMHHRVLHRGCTVGPSSSSVILTSSSFVRKPVGQCAGLMTSVSR